MARTALWLPLFLGAAVSAAYALRKSVPGLPVDVYLAALLGLPLLLLVSGKVSLNDLGIRLGKPLPGLAFVLFLPAVLFLRFYFSGAPLALGFDWYLLLASAAEELFFRGYLQHAFQPLGKYQGFAATNLFFALVHAIKGYSLLLVAMIFAVGAYFSYARDEQGSDSIFYPMGAHGLYNLVATATRGV
ncbi:CPBP family intramembrane metalloprotease [Candidatus Micrarchaeota archaeon]|nr:CPBP family intramembrane metalloprotease [Candidatus Micrarchaeota archaeon]